MPILLFSGELPGRITAYGAPAEVRSYTPVPPAPTEEGLAVVFDERNRHDFVTTAARLRRVFGDGRTTVASEYTPPWYIARIATEVNAMMDGWDMNGWGWAWMSLGMALGVAVVALLVLLLVRGTTQANPPAAQDEALATLRRRFASGEIDQDEYRRRRAELEG